MERHARHASLLAAAVLVCAAASSQARAADVVRVGVFPVASTLPLFVGEDQGFFRAENIDIKASRLIGGPPNVAALISDQIDASAILVTIEGMNADLKKPGVAKYISLDNQNAKYPMESFVVRKGLHITSLKQLKGKKILSAPGPANIDMAEAALAKAGLKKGDYEIDQLDMSQHVSALKAGTFDAGYTLEPNASIMIKDGIAKTLETGVIANTVFGNPNADAWAAGCALSSDFIKNKPDVAKRFTIAWGKAIAFIKAHPKQARKSLVKNTFTPPDLIETVPLPEFRMVSDMSDKNIADFQTFMNFAWKTGILPQKVDVKTAIQRF